MEFDGNGYELLWHALRRYEHQPSSAICAEFIALLPAVKLLHGGDAQVIDD